MVVSVVRTVVVYVVLIVAMRIMGKRQLGELQPTELVVTLIIADLAVIPMQDVRMPLLFGIVPIVVLLALELLLSGAMLKLPFLSRLISGNPLLIIKEGKLDPSVLKRMRMTVEDLTEALRSQGIFDLSEVEYAIAETNGSVSVLQKPPYRPVNREDLAIEVQDTGIPLVVVSDGKVCQQALELCHISESWIYKTLKKEKCNPEDAFLMTCDKERRYFLVKNERKSK